MGALIEIDGVSRHFAARGLFGAAGTPPVMALRAVTLTLRDGETVGLLGESGSGKTTLARILLRLDRPSAGIVRVNGQDLEALRGEALARFRRKAQLVFQNPFEAFNPRLAMRRSLEEPLICAGIPRSEHGARIALALDRARLTDLAGFLDRLPAQLSGGQLQRAAVARAIILEPRILVADEPVSMLDVSIRAAVLGALRAAIRVQGKPLAAPRGDAILGRRGDLVHLGKAREHFPSRGADRIDRQRAAQEDIAILVEPRTQPFRLPQKRAGLGKRPDQVRRDDPSFGDARHHGCEHPFIDHLHHRGRRRTLQAGRARSFQMRVARRPRLIPGAAAASARRQRPHVFRGAGQQEGAHAFARGRQAPAAWCNDEDPLIGDVLVRDRADQSSAPD